MNTESRILEPGQMESPMGEIRFLFLPSRDIFAYRAERLRFLAKDHPLGEYLSFLALIADAQQDALNLFPSPDLPDHLKQMRCRERKKPLLDARTLRRDSAWRLGLDIILGNVSEAQIPSVARATAVKLMRSDKDEPEETADKILAGDLAGVSPQEMPFIAGALQAYGVHMASSLSEDAVGRLEQGSVCPVCGSFPGAGIVRGGGAEQGLRYLSCSLCDSQWHMVRIKCSSCESTQGIDYHILEGSNGAVKAESCEVCNSYLKMMYLSKDPQMEAKADDLATLALDILMYKDGKARGGPNLFYHPGIPV